MLKCLHASLCFPNSICGKFNYTINKDILLLLQLPSVLVKKRTSMTVAARATMNTKHLTKTALAKVFFLWTCSAKVTSVSGTPCITQLSSVKICV